MEITKRWVSLGQMVRENLHFFHYHRKRDRLYGQVELLGSVVLVPQEVKNDPTMEDSTSVKNYADPQNLFQDFEINKIFRELN